MRCRAWICGSPSSATSTRPCDSPAVFARLDVQMHEPARAAAKTPAGEVGQAAAEAIQAFFRTHPPSAERSRQLTEMVAQNRRTLSSRIFYVGVRNYRSRTPHSAAQFPEELRVY